MKLPRGKWNGRRITGLELKISWRYDYLLACPHFHWKWGELVLLLLGLRLQITPTYHYRDP
jgi:hypothetical protein